MVTLSGIHTEIYFIIGEREKEAKEALFNGFRELANKKGRLPYQVPGQEKREVINRIKDCYNVQIYNKYMNGKNLSLVKMTSDCQDMLNSQKRWILEYAEKLENLTNNRDLYSALQTINKIKSCVNTMELWAVIDYEYYLGIRKDNNANKVETFKLEASEELLALMPDGFPVESLLELEARAKAHGNVLSDIEVNNMLPLSVNTTEAIDFILEYLQYKGITIVYQPDEDNDLISSDDSAEEEQLTQDTDLLQSWTCGGIPKKIKDEPKFDEGKND